MNPVASNCFCYLWLLRGLIHRKFGVFRLQLLSTRPESVEKLQQGDFEVILPALLVSAAGNYAAVSAQKYQQLRLPRLCWLGDQDTTAALSFGQAYGQASMEKEALLRAFREILIRPESWTGSVQSSHPRHVESPQF